jgi:deazaflavin-dependent oxidoreductase (nitroreductase family)
MSEYQLASMNITEDNLRIIFKFFNRFMLLLWRLGLGSWGNGTKFGGSLMVIKHTGRKTGLVRHTPVNYAIVNGDIYCTAGFGKVSDWYRNIMVHPEVEVWLPDGRWAGVAEDATDDEYSHLLLQQVIIASGFASDRTRRAGRSFLDLAAFNICLTLAINSEAQKVTRIGILYRTAQH